VKIEGTADEGIEERKQVLPVKEIHWLNFSYRGYFHLSSSVQSFSIWIFQFRAAAAKQKLLFIS